MFFLINDTSYFTEETPAIKFWITVIQTMWSFKFALKYQIAFKSLLILIFKCKFKTEYFPLVFYVTAFNEFLYKATVALTYTIGVSCSQAIEGEIKDSLKDKVNCFNESVVIEPSQ